MKLAAFIDEAGETQARCPLSAEQRIVVWRAESRTPVSLLEQVASIMLHLPEEATREVLACGQFLHERRRPADASSRLRTTAISCSRKEVT
ncbi:MAG: hypothetical protein ACREOH_12380 [Candidatus Entotheonellia bacterium]